MLSSEEFSIARVVLNSDGDKTTDAWRDLAYELDALRRGGEVEVIASLREGDIIATSTDGLDIRVIAPRHRLVQLGVGNRDASNRRITSNSMSGVLLARFNTRPIALVTGDMDALGWDHLQEIDVDLHADVLVIPHHGGWGGSKSRTIAMTSELCKRVEPRHVFISNGRGSYGAPRAEVIAAVRSAAPKARIACTQVSELCLLKLIPRPDMISRSPYSTGARGHACCAGSIDVSLIDDATPFIDVGDHEAFVDQFEATALCRN
jgi:beta-lactamase superfamily II metal-dependent hydrolase